MIQLTDRIWLYLLFVCGHQSWIVASSWTNALHLNWRNVGYLLVHLRLREFSQCLADIWVLSMKGGCFRWVRIHLEHHHHHSLVLLFAYSCLLCKSFGITFPNILQVLHVHHWGSEISSNWICSHRSKNVLLFIVRECFKIIKAPIKAFWPHLESNLVLLESLLRDA